ncbi:DUF692 domain-containing protein [Pseudomonas fluorescens]|uniref:UPF0276 protein PS691_02724 n=1 Tax=Pseudomonas fluorescens TaxID=294 RepID=A0A5E7CD14_PSEFL|nr:hypothetical protein PS691_02724 [Pseudomonas fluorescens]
MQTHRSSSVQQTSIEPALSSSQATVGLGLRRSLLNQLRDAPAGNFDFLEVAPENWIGIGGAHGAALRSLAERYPLSCHGLSLSLGGTAPLDVAFLEEVRVFLDQYKVPLYSEHLSYCSDDGHLYDLLPLPFTEEAVHHVAARIRQAQDVLGRRLAVENVSYYAAPQQDMDELSFTNAVLQEADCDLLLDVNNVYVNSVNHRFDPQAFLAGIAPDRVVAMHVAGHYDESDELKIDTHGAPVKPMVWALLAQAYARFGAKPTLLERDFNFPAFDVLVAELNIIRQLQTGQVVAHG